MKLYAVLYMVIYTHIAKQVTQTYLCYREYLILIFLLYYIHFYFEHVYYDDKCDMIINDNLYT